MNPKNTASLSAPLRATFLLSLFSSLVAFVGLTAPSQAAAQPAIDCSASPAASTLMGTSEDFIVRMDNTGSSPGFVPGLGIGLPAGVTLAAVNSDAGGATSQSVALNSAGNGTHPITGAGVSGPANGRFHFIRPGISSQSPAQNVIVFTVTLGIDAPAEPLVAVPLDFSCEYAYGSDALNNPDTDAPLAESSASSLTGLIVDATLAVMGKDGGASTVTGPNSSVTWLYSIDVADGFTVESADFAHVFPESFFVQSAVGSNVTIDAFTPGPGVSLSGSVANLVGTSAAAEATVLVTGHVPQFVGASTVPVLDPTTGAPVDIESTATLSALMLAGASPPMVPDLVETASLFASSMLVTESIAGGPFCPTDAVLITVEVCVSDYFTFNNVRLSTPTPDGINYVSSTNGGTMESGGVVSTPMGTLDGTSAVGSAASASVTYTYAVEETYDSGDPVLGSDTFDFVHTGGGDIVGGNPFTITESAVRNPIAGIKGITAQKAIVAVNGLPYTGEPINPGDVVTFRLTVTFNSGDQSAFSITDYLPLPKFDSQEHGASPGFGADIRLTANHDMPVAVSIATSAADNSISFSTPAFTVPSATAPVTFEVDMDFTMNNAPFDDDFQLINFATYQAGATTGSVSGNANVELTTGEPFLRLYHGAIEVRDEAGTAATGVFSGSTGPTIPMNSTTLAATPLTANVLNNNPMLPDAGDTVVWRVIVDNEGDFPAHHVAISDAFRAHFFGMPTNFTVTDGNGVAVTGFTGGITAEGFAITFTNPIPPSNGVDGASIRIVTFEAALGGGVDARHSNFSDASIDFYSSGAGLTAPGDNFAPNSSASNVTRQARSRDFGITQSCTPTTLAIQDVGDCTLTWTLPEGTHAGLRLRTVLPTGLAIVGTPTASMPTVTFSGSGSPVVLASGQQAEINLDDVTNTNRDSTVVESVTMTYTSVATNVSANQRGARPRMTLQALYEPSPPSAATRATQTRPQPFTILEPTLTLTDTVSPARVRRGDTVTYTVSIEHSGASNSDARDARYRFTLPAELENLSITSAPSTAPSSQTVTASSVAYDWSNIADGSAAITFAFTATVRSTVTPIVTVNSSATLDWTSQGGTPVVLTLSPDATERTGADGAGGLNDYVAATADTNSVVECLTVLDCDDANASCTTDSCSAAGACVFTPVDVGDGCLTGMGVCSGSGGTPANACEVCLDDSSGSTGDTGCVGMAQCDTSGGTGMHMCTPCLDSAMGASLDDGCTSASPVCNGTGASAMCVECTENSHCTGADVCDPTTFLCRPASCGNDLVEPGESCDEGANNGPDGTCSTGCRFNHGSGPCTGDIDCQGTAVCDTVRVPSVCLTDSDGDGVGDLNDPDDDNDGVLDTTEGSGPDPSADADNDFIPDYLDTDAVGFVDDNSDGVDDRFDFDGDGVPNHLDGDADNDGLSDAYEAGGEDADGDGLLDGCVDVSTMNGLCDSAEATPLPVPNTDGVAGPDFLDLDSDGDGITDATESGAEDLDGDGVPDNFADVDDDGMNDNGLTTMPRDTDGDATPDHLQLDSDGDGIPDATEGHDADGNGAADVMASGTDTDADGIDDAFDPDCVSTPECAVIGVIATLPDADNDMLPDYRDLDSDGDGITDAVECGPSMHPMCFDSDEDGILDYLETDSDNDGLPDLTEAYDLDEDGTADTTAQVPTGLDDDGDGIDNAFDGDCTSAAPCTDSVVGFVPNLPDSDNDLIPDYRDTDDDADGIPTATEVTDGATHGDDPDNDMIPAYLDLDSDGDGADDMSEGGMDPTLDLDGDTIPDYLDPDSAVLDSDMDGIADHLECPSLQYLTSPMDCLDSDMDGTPDHLDADDDNDGIPTATELLDDMSDDNDADGDGIPSHLDLDSDADGVLDIREGGGVDVDSDGKVDDCVDTDPMDGVCDGISLAPPNTDGVSDGSDPYDTDSDNDGILDTTEAFDADSDGTADIVPSGADANMDGVDDAFADAPDAADHDMDGVPDHLDLDSDNDGILDSIECGPAAPMCVDTDTDGTPDYLDLDSDNDGINDAIEGHDVDADGVADVTLAGTDTNGNGLDDAYDADVGGTRAPTPDHDGDSIPDYQDVDSDGDGLRDDFECASGPVCPDADEDGTPDYLDIDSDNDTIPDATEGWDVDMDGEPDTVPSGTDANNDGLDDAYGTPPEIDTDSDGTANRLDDDDDDDGIPSADEPGDADGGGVPDYLEGRPALGGLAGGAVCSASPGQAPNAPWILLTLAALGLLRRRRR